MFNWFRYHWMEDYPQLQRLPRLVKIHVKTYKTLEDFEEAYTNLVGLNYILNRKTAITMVEGAHQLARRNYENQCNHIHSN